jgi:hypothetical protein
VEAEKRRHLTVLVDVHGVGKRSEIERGEELLEQPVLRCSSRKADTFMMVASSAIIGGLGALLLRNALRRSGALDLIGA